MSSPIFLPFSSPHFPSLTSSVRPRSPATLLLRRTARTTHICSRMLALPPIWSCSTPVSSAISAASWPTCELCLFSVFYTSPLLASHESHGSSTIIQSRNLLPPTRSFNRMERMKRYRWELGGVMPAHAQPLASAAEVSSMQIAFSLPISFVMCA